MRRGTPSPREEPDFVQAGGASPLVTPERFGLPRRARYNPTILAEALDRDISARTWQREFEDGHLEGVKIRGVWWTTYEHLLRYFLTRSNVISPN